jgi:hypothetical protein
MFRKRRFQDQNFNQVIMFRNRDGELDIRVGYADNCTTADIILDRKLAKRMADGLLSYLETIDNDRR